MNETICRQITIDFHLKEVKTVVFREASMWESLSYKFGTRVLNVKVWKSGAMIYHRKVKTDDPIYLKY